MKKSTTALVVAALWFLARAAGDDQGSLQTRAKRQIGFGQQNGGSNNDGKSNATFDCHVTMLYT